MHHTLLSRAPCQALKPSLYVCVRVCVYVCIYVQRPNSMLLEQLPCVCLQMPCVGVPASQCALDKP